VQQDKMNPIYDKNYTDYQLSRGTFRAWVRDIYMRQAARLTQGITLDFGCGIGDLLSKLPLGSVGLEYNPTTVQYAKTRGLDVYLYDGFKDDWQLSSLPSHKKFQTLVISHVLEHFDRPFEILKDLLESVKTRGITRLIIIVPGIAGFKIDKTHRFFVDPTSLENFFSKQTEWQIESMRYFPLNSDLISKIFAHNELQVVVNRLQN